MERFLTFILFFVLIIWLLARFFPFLLAWWVKRRIQKMERERGGFRHYSQKKAHKEGDVFVDVDKKDKKVVDNSVGEYVDYEETK